MNDIVTDVKVTKRIEWKDWDIIKTGPLFIEFLRHQVTFNMNQDVEIINGEPNKWIVIDWVEENATDVWYLDGDTIYFYAEIDAMAFKLRW